MNRYSLNGKWKLYFYENGSICADTPEKLLSSGVDCVKATVPGNVELDLVESGYLPKDLFKGENIKLAEKYERYDWWYEKEFDAPDDLSYRKYTLKFEAVDCFAEYFLNGEKIGASDNMLIDFEFDVTGKLLEKSNKLFVHIRSALAESYKYDTNILSVAARGSAYVESAYVRKAPHCYGWDIMPRALSAGIWRDVNVVAYNDFEVSQFYYCVSDVKKESAGIKFIYELDMIDYNTDDMYVEIKGKCKDSEFFIRKEVIFKAGNVDIKIDNPKLWWPYGYGNPYLYDIEVKFFKNEKLVSVYNCKLGIRDIKLDRTGTTDGADGKFAFLINGIQIMCKGSNWVPMDVYHSRDKERYKYALELVKDLGCNILRCWGGNVYEDHEFYDFCDENGIMVWQDFAMACMAYPNDEKFADMMRKEVTSVVRKLRNHPSIIMWAGDNECDCMLIWNKKNPNDNIITRKVIPEVIYNNDIGRPYLPSSPYYDEENYLLVQNTGKTAAPEEHLWGPRDYFKSDYYKNAKAHFVSETGYHGCPSANSVRKFIDEEFVWPYHNNSQWNLHSSDQNNSDKRTLLMEKQIKQLFGVVPENLEEYALASQISQAEAKKFFIENVRINKPVKSGIIWWNLIDGWPQMSDAVVDYYYEKKLAYDFIKRSQNPFVIMAGEVDRWKIRFVASNDTLKDKKGNYKVTDAETGREMFAGEFDVPGNKNLQIGEFELMYSEKGMLLIEWEIDGERNINHYLYGYPAFELEKYKEWLDKIR